MVSRKCLFSYRILTARLREGAVTPTVRVVGINGKPAVTQPQSIAVNAEFAEAQPGRHLFFLRAGQKE